MADRDRSEAREGQRRRLLQAGLGAAALGAIPGAGQLAAQAQGAFDWKRFKGEKIEVFLVKSPRGDLLTKYHKEFEDLTGITVGSEMIPEQQQRQKAVIEFNSGNTELRRDRDLVSRAEAAVRQEQVAGGRPPAASPTSRSPTPISTSPISPRAGSTTRRSPTAASTACRSTSTRGSSTTTRSCSTRRASRIRRASPRWSTRRRRLNDPAKGVSGFVGARTQERQRAGVDELPARLRRRASSTPTAS